MKNRINSRAKGARIERLAADFLRGFGFNVSRNARNGLSAADLDLSQDPDLRLIHLEVKGDRSIGLGTKALADAMEQSICGSDGKPYGVLWYEHRKGWRLTTSAVYHAQVKWATFSGEDISGVLRAMAERERKFVASLASHLAVSGGQS